MDRHEEWMDSLKHEWMNGLDAENELIDQMDG